MTLRRLSGFALLFSAGAAVFGQEPTPRPKGPPVIRFVTPTSHDLPVGETRVELEVTGALKFDEMDFFVDGRKIGTVEGRFEEGVEESKWQIVWQAGDAPQRHELSVALLRGGREIANTRMKTREVGFTSAPSVHVVGISPIVTDGSGHPVPGLSRKDFTVFDDGQQQKIETFDSTDSPMAVILVLDTSGSMLPRRDDARRAAHAFLEALKPEDEVGLCTFNSAIVGTQLDLTRDRKVLDAAIDKALPEGETAIYDVTAAALRRLKSVKRRKAVVLFTDAADNRSRLSVTQVIDMARAAEVSVFSVAMAADESKVPMVFLNQLAEETGGRAYFIGNIKKLPVILRSILTDLKSQYFLTYTPENLKPHSRHHVRVQINRSNVIIRAKKEYVVE